MKHLYKAGEVTYPVTIGIKKPVMDYINREANTAGVWSKVAYSEPSNMKRKTITLYAIRSAGNKELEDKWKPR